MKKNLLSKISIMVSALIIFLFTGTGLTFAQDHKVELTPFGGYMLGGSIKFYEGKFKVENAGCYGGMLAVQLRSGSFVEFSYTGMTTKGNWEPYSDYFNDPDFLPFAIDMAVNHFQIGSVNELQLDNESIRPYGTFSVGTTWFNPKDDRSDDEWLFSVGAGLGLKYFFNEKIGIRMQARLLLPLVYNGAGFYLGTGGSGMYVSSTAPIIQGDFTGGLIIALGDY